MGITEGLKRGTVELMLLTLLKDEEIIFDTERPALDKLLL